MEHEFDNNLFIEYDKSVSYLAASLNVIFGYKSDACVSNFRRSKRTKRTREILEVKLEVQRKQQELETVEWKIIQEINDIVFSQCDT